MKASWNEQQQTVSDEPQHGRIHALSVKRHETRSTATFHEHPGKPVPTGMSILDFVGAKDEEGGEW